MSLVSRLLAVALIGVGMGAAESARAGFQLFEASWVVKAFGNERTGGTGESEFYSAFGIPQGVQCNPRQPRCPFDSTPTDGAGHFSTFGGDVDYALHCAPWFNWGGGGTTVRPAKGQTEFTVIKGIRPIPPLYRNPRFFTPAGEPNTNSCTAISTGATPGGKGLVQAGKSITGTWGAATTGTQKGSFSFAAAPQNNAFGIRTTGQAGDMRIGYPHVYNYTYATLRNDAGVFGPGQGPGNVNLVYQSGSEEIANIHVKQGVAKFGGSMRMLGALTSKVCYFRNGTCSRGEPNWRYEAIGAPADTYGGVVTAGYVAYQSIFYYRFQKTTVRLLGYRFPWTTGSVTVSATKGGKWQAGWQHKTVHYAHGYDNRNTTTPSGRGTIQLVSPVLTRWLQPCCNEVTAGIGVLRIKFLPEPRAWMVLAAGASLLAVGARMRDR